MGTPTVDCYDLYSFSKGDLNCDWQCENPEEEDNELDETEGLNEDEEITLDDEIET